MSTKIINIIAITIIDVEEERNCMCDRVFILFEIISQFFLVKILLFLKKKILLN